MPAKKINVAIVGLGFGAEFIPIFQAHPNANLVAVCQRDPKKLKAIQDAFGIPKGYTDAVLDDEFPLSMFFEALDKKMKPVIESTAGITGRDS